MPKDIRWILIGIVILLLASLIVTLLAFARSMPTPALLP